jgi:hypothetical protein
VATRPQPSPSQAQTNALGLIGIALWFGVIAFGVVVFFVHRAGTFPIRPQPMGLRYASAAMSVLAVTVALVLRGGVRQMEDGPDRNTRVLTLWAVGEGAALFGGVLYLLTNEPQWYGLGLLAMLTTFVLVPLRRVA